MTVGPSVVNNLDVDNKCTCTAHGFDEPTEEVVVGVIVGKETTSFLVPRQEIDRQKVKVRIAVRRDASANWHWAMLDETVDLDADVDPNAFWKKFDFVRMDNVSMYRFTCSTKGLQFEEVKNICDYEQ